MADSSRLSDGYYTSTVFRIMMPKSLKHFIKYLYNKYRFRNKGIVLSYSASVSKRSQIEGKCVINNHATFHGTLGIGSIIARYVNLEADVGRFTSIGARSTAITTRHPYKEPFVTSSPCFYSLKKQLGYTFAKKQTFKEYKYFDEKREIAVKIGNDCWLGVDVCMIGGVEIGDGAIVLSKAYVTKDVPPYAIVGGIPAKVIGYRYDEETIKFLQEVQWWNQDIEWLKEHWELFSDMEAFKQYWQSHSK